MSEKNINSRIQHKHDTAANWSKATNFAPKAGELIIYDIDDNYSYPRIKIGDGTTNIDLLPFTDKELATVEYVNSILSSAGGGVGIEYVGTIGTAWEGSAALYTQTIPMAGLLSSDDGIVGLVSSENYETSKLQLAEWAKIHRIETANGSIVVYATAPTTMELNIQMLVTRDGVIETEVLDGALLLNGSVTIDKISSSAKTQYFNVSLAANGWVGSAAPYSQTVTLNSILASDKPKVYFEVPTAFADLEPQQSAFATLYDVETANGSVTFKAKELPEVAFNVTLEVSRI